MVSWGNLADRLEQWASSKYAKFEKKGLTSFGVSTKWPDQKDTRSCEVHSVIPFADRLWISTGWGGAGLYELDQNFHMEARDEGIPDDNFGRLYHPGTDKVATGRHIIDQDREVETVRDGEAWAIHIDKPDTHAYLINYGGEVFEVDMEEITTTKVADLSDHVGWVNMVNGAFTRFDKLYLAVAHPNKGGLYSWDGASWATVVSGYPLHDVHSFVEITHNPLYTWGRDDFSAVLIWSKDGTTWNKYRLPKCSRRNDQSSEQWGRIRPVSSYEMLGFVSGCFYRLPYALNTGGTGNTPGFRPQPLCRTEWYPFDFCSFQGLMAVGRSENFPLKYHSGQPQSGLGFVRTEDLWSFGKPKGYGGVWKDTSVGAGDTSDPFLVNGFDEAILHLWTDTAGDFTIEVDPVGDGTWKTYDTVSLSAGEYRDYGFPTEFNAVWVRVSFSETASVGAWFNLG